VHSDESIVGSKIREAVIMKLEFSSGSQEKVVCLISGGIDSPVAAWMAMRKGLATVFVYFDNSPFADETTRERAVDTVKKLVKHAEGSKVKLHIIPHGNDLADILRNCPRNLTCLLCRRMMYRIAEKIAEIEGAEALVTGEIIGEHASQTLRNLHVENTALSQISVMRPLAGMNKTEVEEIARKIGTFTASTKPASCCSGPPPKPRTRARLEEVLEAERKLHIESMIERDLKGALVLTV
jgi:thiamine biosynthesis protein ThiI